MKGLIYRAYNTISQKSYIGQTVRTLKERVKWHYSASKKGKYHFASALRRYGREDWIWSVEEVCEIDQLDSIEKELIAFYDSYKNGYNKTTGGKPLLLTQNPLYKSETIDVYSLETGSISCTRKYLRDIFDLTAVQISDLIARRSKASGSFVLEENRDKYDEILNIITLSHPILGVIKAKSKVFYKEYGLNKHQISYLKKRLIKTTLSGWSLA